jgi:hypothetical protein
MEMSETKRLRETGRKNMIYESPVFPMYPIRISDCILA